jgi:hypothetical protein
MAIRTEIRHLACVFNFVGGYSGSFGDKIGSLLAGGNFRLSRLDLS